MLTFACEAFHDIINDRFLVITDNNEGVVGNVEEFMALID